MVNDARKHSDKSGEEADERGDDVADAVREEGEQQRDEGEGGRAAPSEHATRVGDGHWREDESVSQAVDDCIDVVVEVHSGDVEIAEVPADMSLAAAPSGHGRVDAGAPRSDRRVGGLRRAEDAEADGARIGDL